MTSLMEQIAQHAERHGCTQAEAGKVVLNRMSGAQAFFLGMEEADMIYAEALDECHALIRRYIKEQSSCGGGYA